MWLNVSEASVIIQQYISFLSFFEFGFQKFHKSWTQVIINRIRKVFIQIKYFLKNRIHPVKNCMVKHLSSQISHSALFFFRTYFKSIINGLFYLFGVVRMYF